MYDGEGSDKCKLCNKASDKHNGSARFCSKSFANAVSKIHKIQTRQLFSLCREGNTEAVEALVAAGCPVNVEDPQGRTPLHCACHWGNARIVESLLAAGADVKAKARNGLSAIRFACEGGGLDCIRVLVKAGVSCNEPCDEIGRTLLHLACRRRAASVCELLLVHNADVGARDVNASTPLHESAQSSEEVKLLISHKADVTARDFDQRTPLHKFSYAGNQNVCLALLTAKAHVNAQDAEGTSPPVSGSTTYLPCSRASQGLIFAWLFLSICSF